MKNNFGLAARLSFSFAIPLLLMLLLVFLRQMQLRKIQLRQIATNPTPVTAPVITQVAPGKTIVN